MRFLLPLSASLLNPGISYISGMLSEWDKDKVTILVGVLSEDATFPGKIIFMAFTAVILRIWK